MALTIEDGSQVSGADSYVTAAEYIAWADARFGAARSTAPADTDAAEVLILRAMDYFESLVFLGQKVSSTQSLQFPRVYLVIDGYDVLSTTIPADVKKSLYEITYAEELGTSELAQVDRKTKREKVGDIEIEYTDNSSSRTTTPAIRHSMRKLVAAVNLVSRA